GQRDGREEHVRGRPRRRPQPDGPGSDAVAVPGAAPRAARLGDAARRVVLRRRPRRLAPLRAPQPDPRWHRRRARSRGWRDGLAVTALTPASASGPILRRAARTAALLQPSLPKCLFTIAYDGTRYAGWQRQSGR